MLLGAFLIAWSAPEIGPAFRGATGGGSRGTFTLERNQCVKTNCHWRGDFTSADGRVVRRHVRFDGDLPPGAGAKVAARDTGSRSYVFGPDSSFWWWWGQIILLTSGLVCALGGPSALIWPLPGADGRMWNETGD